MRVDLSQAWRYNRQRETGSFTKQFLEHPNPFLVCQPHVQMNRGTEFARAMIPHDLGNPIFSAETFPYPNPGEYSEKASMPLAKVLKVLADRTGMEQFCRLPENGGFMNPENRRFVERILEKRLMFFFPLKPNFDSEELKDAAAVGHSRAHSFNRVHTMAPSFWSFTAQPGFGLIVVENPLVLNK